MISMNRGNGISLVNHRSIRSRRKLWQCRRISRKAEDHCFHSEKLQTLISRAITLS